LEELEQTFFSTELSLVGLSSPQPKPQNIPDSTDKTIPTAPEAAEDGTWWKLTIRSAKIRYYSLSFAKTKTSYALVLQGRYPRRYAHRVFGKNLPENPGFFERKLTKERGLLDSLRKHKRYSQGQRRDGELVKLRNGRWTERAS